MNPSERKALMQELESLPAGTLVRRTIRGAERFYHQWREDGKTRSRYLSRDEADALRRQVERKKAIKRLLAGSPQTPNTPTPTAFKTDIATGKALVELTKGIEGFKTRDMFPSVMKYLRSDSTDRVLIVCGLRRTGKTTMLRQAMRSLSPTERRHAAYVKVAETDTMAALKADLTALHEEGFKFVFIDEVTLMEDFIDTASVLSDLFAGMGMKIVLSGTDSLGFWFAEHDELYDRAFTLHTTFIPFREHARLLGTRDVDNYIGFGGTLRTGSILFDHKDAKNDAASFRSDESTRFYIDTAIARNIQHSLKCVDSGRHFRLLIDLYEAGELTNAINRIIEDMNHRFVLQVLEREFESGDLKLAKRNIVRSSDPERHAEAILRADIPKVTKRLMGLLDIRNADERKRGLTDGCAEQIREYLTALDLIVPCPVEYMGKANASSERILFAQPGMRFCQAQALVHALMEDPALVRASALERKIVRDAILNEVRGRMLEDIVLLETIKARADATTSVFKLQFAAGEFDMVIADTENLTCQLFEIKHSTERDDRQLRHLVDDEKLAATEHRFGEITSRAVLYRGRDVQNVSGIAYRNVEKYLMSL